MALIFRAMMLSEETPNNLGLICRTEFTDLRDSTIKDFTRYTGLEVGSDREVKLSNGSIIMFRHAKELNILKNINLGWFAIEQAEELLDRTNWDYLMGRLRRDAVRRSGFVVANTDGHNWIWDMWKNEAKPEYPLFEATTYDNSENLPQDFLDSLKDLPEAIYKRFVMNSWDSVAGQVYKEWDEKLHVISPFEIPYHWEKIGGLDTAVGAGTTAALACAVDPDNNLIFYKEYYASDRLASEHANDIKESMPEIDIWYTDPSAFNKTREKLGSLYSVADEFSEHGLNLVRAENDVLAGINRVSEYLHPKEGQHPYKLSVEKAPRMFFFPCCVNTLREMPQYKWSDLRPSSTGDRQVRPYKHADHGVDVVKYVCTSRPNAAEVGEVVPLKKRNTLWLIQKQQENKEAFY